MRSGYCDDIDQRDLAMWRGRVASSIRGQRGQRLLRDCLTALDAMSEKRLIPNQLIDGKDVCLLGAAGRHRQVDLAGVDPEAHGTLGDCFNVAECLIKEIEFINDECPQFDMNPETPEQRWVRVRAWVVKHIDP